MITTGFAPYEFSESIVNSKLALALINAGHEVNVISRESKQTYSVGWTGLWKPLETQTYFISEKRTNRLKRFIEILFSLLFFKYPMEGIRWGYKVYYLALRLNKNRHYDILLTRMPSLAPHLVGKKIKKKIGIPWIANWNDPTDNIRPTMKNKNPLKSLINNILVREIFRKASINTYPSKELFDFFNDKILHMKHFYVEIIPHIGIEVNTKLDQIPVKNNEFKMCYTGNLCSNVNSDLFFQALVKLKYVDNQDFKLHLFGSINKKFLDQIYSFRLSDNIIPHGSFKYELILSELVKYEVLVLIEAQYDTGILLLSKLSDYASVRKPVFCISPKKGVIPDYINKYGGGLAVNNQDPESIYDGLKIMINEWKNDWPDKKIASSSLLYEQFNPYRIVSKYELLFDKFLKHNYTSQ